jgi:subtilisin family serine protease
MRKHLLGVVSVISLVLGLMVGLPAAQGAESEQPVGAADASPQGSEPAYVPGEVLVTFDAEATRQQKRSVRAQAAGGRLTTRSSTPDRVGPNVELMPLGQGISVTEAIADLEDKPGVVAVEPNYILHTTAMPNDPYLTDGSLWGMYGAATTPSNAYGSNAAAAWDAGYTGSDKVYVAVIDEVVDVNHPDLADNMWSNAAEVNGTTGVDDDGNGVVDDVHGYDVVAGTGIVDSTNAGDHGTHVAGTIGAVGGNGIGVSGVSPDVSLISVGAFRNLSGTTADVITALDYVTKLRTKLGIDIVATNNSWGGPGSRALLDAIKRGGDAGILFVAAAGNDGFDNDPELAYDITGDQDSYNWVCNQPGMEGR